MGTATDYYFLKFTAEGRYDESIVAVAANSLLSLNGSGVPVFVPKSDFLTTLQMTAHLGAVNPHNVTASQVGLGNVLNVAQVPASEKGASNGVATLDVDGQLTPSQIPLVLLGAMKYTSGWNASTNTPAIPAASEDNRGHYYRVQVAGTTSIGGETDWSVGDLVVSNGSAWEKYDQTDQVTSVAGKSGAVTLVSSDVGLGAVENTTLSTWAGGTALTTLGTVTVGTWHGTAIADGYIASASTWNAKQNALTAGTDYLAPGGNGSALSGLTKGQVGLGSVENVALSTWAGSTALTTLGTVTVGTWHGTAIADGYIASASTWNAKQNALTAGTDYLAPGGNGSALSGLTKGQVGLDSVENVALSTWVGSAAITTLGTITSGTVPFARLSGAAASGANNDITSLGALTLISLAQNVTAGLTATGMVIANSGAATSGNQRFSPALRFTGAGWSSTSSASQAVHFDLSANTIEGTTNPSGKLSFRSAVNGISFTEAVAIGISGTASSSTTTGAFIVTGGLGVSGAIFGSTLNLSGAVTAAGFTGTSALAANTVGVGLQLTNTAAATSGNQGYSPAIRWTGQGWKTSSVAASQAVDFRAYVVPGQGAANPFATWTLDSSVNGGAFGGALTYTTSGVLSTLRSIVAGDGPTMAQFVVGDPTQSHQYGIRNANGVAIYCDSSDVLTVSPFGNGSVTGWWTVGGCLITNGIRSGYVAKTSAYTITNTDHTIDCTSGTFALTLPTAASASGQEYVLKNSGTGLITVNATTGQTVDGYASGALTIPPKASYVLKSNGANWIIARVADLTGASVVGVLPALRGGAASFAPARTSNAQAVLRAGTRPLRVWGFGDSVAFDPMRRMVNKLTDALGNAGGGQNSYDWFYGASKTSDGVGGFTELLPGQAAGAESIDSGEYVIYLAQAFADPHALMPCDKITVGYLRRSGAGTFKIQSRLVDGGSWTDEGSTINTANTTVDFQSVSITLSYAPRQFRILGVTGTVQTMCPIIERSTGRGIMSFLVCTAGAEISGYTNSTTSVRRAWLASLAPDVILLRWYDDLVAFEAGIVAMQGDLVALGLATDIVIMGPSPSTSSPASVIGMEQRFRELGMLYSIAFISTFDGFNLNMLSGDGLHPGDEGNRYIADDTLRQIGWLELPDVKRAAQHISRAASSYTLPDSTTYAAVATPRLELTTGTWKIRGMVSHSCTNPGLGFKAQLAFTGSSYIPYGQASSGAYGAAMTTRSFNHYGFNPGLPLLLTDTNTGSSWGSGTFEFMIYLAQSGTLQIQAAKEATGADSVFVDQGTFLEAVKLED
jgi:hypothetical protein